MVKSGNKSFKKRRKAKTN